MKLAALLAPTPTVGAIFGPYPQTVTVDKLCRYEKYSHGSTSLGSRLLRAVIGHSVLLSRATSSPVWFL